MRRLLILLPCLLVPIAGAAVYQETLDYPFQHDDIWNVVNNEYVHLTQLDLPALQRAMGGHHKSRLRPLSNLGFALSFYFGNLRPAAFRSVNIALHALNALLVYLLLLWTLRLVPAPEPHQGTPAALVAGLLALVWAVHPLHVSAVTYIHQRMMLQTSLFFLLGLFAFMAARRADSAGRRRFFTLLCGCAFVCSVTSKEIGLLFPFALVLLEWAVLRKARTAWLREHWKLSALLCVVMLLVGGLVLRLYGWHWLVGIYGSWHAPVARLASQCRVLLLYLGLWAVPHPDLLSFEHAFNQTVSWSQPWTTLPGLLVPVALVWAALAARKRFPLVCFGILWFLLQLSIEAPLIALDLIAEYRMYLASLGLLFVVADGLRRLPRRTLVLQLLVLGTLAGVYGTWNMQRNRVWQSVESLWGDAAAKNPSDYRSQLNYGIALAELGRHEEALPYIEAAIEIFQSWNACSALSRSLWYLGRKEEAQEYLELAAKWMPSHWNGRVALAQNMELQGQTELARNLVLQDTNRMTVRSLLGRIAATEGDLEQAEYWLRSLVELRPTSRLHRLVLARYYQGRGQPAKAAAEVEVILGQRPLLFEHRLECCRILVEIGELERARAMMPGLLLDQRWNGQVHLLFGRVCELEGDAEGALNWYQTALERGAEDVAAWTFLGRAASELGNYPEAALCYRACLDLEPSVETGRNLAAALSRCERPEEAELVLREILEFHDDPKSQELLGVVLAQQARYAEAIPCLEVALQATPDDVRLQKILATCRERAALQPQE